MTISLEELHKQRAQIQQHMDWLDAKIAEAELQAPPTSSSEEVIYDKNTATSPQQSSSSQTPKSESIAPPSETKGDEKSHETLTQDAAIPEIESCYKPKTQNEVLRAKIGCFAFFMIMIGLFLFTLFVLPYLW
jgi:hypothetical protein